MDETPHKAEEQQGVSWRLWIVLLLLYPWGIGPLEWLYRHSHITRQTYLDFRHLVFWPVQWLYNHSETARLWIEWYLWKFD